MSSTATLGRRIADLRQQVREIRQVREQATRPTRTAVELAGDLGLVLDPWQERALMTTSHDSMLLASRQAGKSTIAGVKALHQSIYAPGSLTLIVSPAERQSKRLLRSIRKLYNCLLYTSPSPRDS